MPRHPVELAREHYERLPAVLKQALFSAEIAEQMFEIGKKFGLTIEKTGIMAEETGYVMLGLARPNELVENLANELQINKDKAQDVGAEINHQIFFPLREELKRTHNFDMDAGQSAGVPDTSRILGMHMPASVKLATSSSLTQSEVERVKKISVEEKSPLVADLTRVREETTKPTAPVFASPPSFEPFASPSGRIADLQKMAAKPPLPITMAPIKSMPPKPELKPAVSNAAPNKPLISQPKELPELKASFAEDTQQNRPSAPVPLDLRPPPSAPRMTPQLQDLPARPDGQSAAKDQLMTEAGPTLLEEKMRLEPQPKAAPPKSAPISDAALLVSSAARAPTGADPYREPIDA